jgi:hypothetical protein
MALSIGDVESESRFGVFRLCCYGSAVYIRYFCVRSTYCSLSLIGLNLLGCISDIDWLALIHFYNSSPKSTISRY